MSPNLMSLADEDLVPYVGHTPLDDPCLVTQFTEGQCHLLALHVHRLTGLDLAVITCDGGPDVSSWCHAMVAMDDGRWLDVCGPQNDYQVRDHWGSVPVRLDPYNDDEHLWLVKEFEHDAAEPDTVSMPFLDTMHDPRDVAETLVAAYL